MQNLTPPPPACPRCGFRPESTVSVLDFEPVPRKPRYDGWTPERQRAFIEALAELGSVSAAARRINMSAEGAYYLRRQKGADGFARAWEAALAHGVQRLTDIAMERAIDGVPVPIIHHGEQVGERRIYNDRLMMFMLKHHDPDRYGGHRPLRPGTRSWELENAEGQREYRDAIFRIRDRLTRARRLMLLSISGDRRKRRAWETLVGKVDWNKAKRLEAQPDEPFFDPEQPEKGSPNARDPDFQVTLDNGWVPELGGPDALEPLRRQVRATWPPESNDDLSPAEQAAIAEYREHLIGEGWTADEDGTLRPPSHSKGDD